MSEGHLIKIVEAKVGELVHRHRVLAMAIANNDAQPLHFFTVMTRESAKAVEFWLGELEKSVMPTEAADE